MQAFTFRDIPDDPSRPDLIREAWADFRGTGHADLRSVQESLNDRADALCEEGEGGWTASDDHAGVQVLKARAHAVGMMMEWIEENGPAVPEWDELTEDEKDEILTARNTFTRIAQGILHVLGNGQVPSTQTELLNEVDELRGNKERSTYRHLRRSLDDPPSSVSGWQKWAESRTKSM